jgi:MraZ protein
MLIGEYTHNFDEKKRVSLPSKFRKEIGKKVVITHGLDSCLFLYPLKEWEKISEKLGSLSLGQADTRGFNRFLLAGAQEIDVDAGGRVLIPDYLREFAHLETSEKRGVVFAGVHNRIEIWNEARWKEYKQKITAEADHLAEKLGEVGAL